MEEKNEFLSFEACELIEGASADVHVNRNECEVRADIVVERRRSVRIWGQVLTTDHSPVENALVQLVRVSAKCECGKVYEGIAHTVTDSKGFYQFEVCCPRDEFFKILVGKPASCIRVIPLLEESLEAALYRE